MEEGAEDDELWQMRANRLKDRLSLTVIRIAEAEAEKSNCIISAPVMTAVADLTFKYADAPNSTDVSPNGSSKVDNDIYSFLNEHVERFIDDIPDELPPRREMMIIGLTSSQEALLRINLFIESQVDELVQKGMVRPSSSPFCSPVLLVHKKDDTYKMCGQESHAPPYAGHRGIQATMNAIETYFFWLTMKEDIQEYVSQCIICQKVKYDRGKQLGLLQLLPILDSPWESIAMDLSLAYQSLSMGIQEYGQ
ncbi:hypothetical protein L7F22_061217 [Adiantum nelumboides]|nr:hypothetical protein [Adiantum nelumboides]